MSDKLNVAHITLWRQLKVILRDMALTELSPGDKIPTEPELCERYNISRVTVRQAVSSLVHEGVLARQQGKGTFVLPRKLDEPLASAFVPTLSEADDSETLPGMPHTRLLTVEELPADKRLVTILQVALGDPVYKVRKLRLISSEPVHVNVAYVPASLCPSFLRKDIANTSLLEIISREYGLEAVTIDESVECITADDYRSSVLDIPVGAPIVLVERLYYLSTGVPVQFSRSFYRSDRYRLRRTISKTR